MRNSRRAGSLGVEDASPRANATTRMSISGISNMMTVPRWVARTWVKSEPKPRGFGGRYVTSTGPSGLHGRRYPQNTNSNPISRLRPNFLSFDYAKITTKLSPLPSPITPIGTTFNTPPTPNLMQSHPNPGSALGQQVPRSPVRFDLQRGHAAYKNWTKSQARNLTTMPRMTTTRTRIPTRRPSLMLLVTTTTTLFIMISPSPLHGAFH